MLIPVGSVELVSTVVVVFVASMRASALHPFSAQHVDRPEMKMLR
jgi:hypothetical protein